MGLKSSKILEPPVGTLSGVASVEKNQAKIDCVFDETYFSGVGPKYKPARTNLLNELSSNDRTVHANFQVGTLGFKMNFRKNSLIYYI